MLCRTVLGARLRSNPSGAAVVHLLLVRGAGNLLLLMRLLVVDLDRRATAAAQGREDCPDHALIDDASLDRIHPGVDEDEGAPEWAEGADAAADEAARALRAVVDLAQGEAAAARSLEADQCIDNTTLFANVPRLRRAVYSPPLCQQTCACLAGCRRSLDFRDSNFPLELRSIVSLQVHLYTKKCRLDRSLR